VRIGFQATIKKSTPAATEDVVSEKILYFTGENEDLKQLAQQISEQLQRREQGSIRFSASGDSDPRIERWNS
jgi:hypothetical protein